MIDNGDLIIITLAIYSGLGFVSYNLPKLYLEKYNPNIKNICVVALIFLFVYNMAVNNSPQQFNFEYEGLLDKYKWPIIFATMLILTAIFKPDYLILTIILIFLIFLYFYFVMMISSFMGKGITKKELYQMLPFGFFFVLYLLNGYIFAEISDHRINKH